MKDLNELRDSSIARDEVPVNQRRRLAFVMIVAMCGTVAAQQLTPVPKPLTDPVHPRRSPVDWTSPAVNTVPGEVTAVGPAVRIAASGDRTIINSQLTLTRPFTVSAVFHRNTTSGASSPYGLTLGCAETVPCAMAFLVRPDGAASVRHPATIDGPWTATSELRAAPEGGLAADLLEVRVSGTTAVFTVNRKTVLAVPVADGELDGQVGVHVATGADVLVTALTVELPPAPTLK